MAIELQTRPLAILADLKAAWAEIGPQSCPNLYNFHMHTIHSDGQLSPERVVDQILDLGLKGFAITDHHSVAAYHQAQALLPAQGPHLWTGAEITSQLLGCEVHILGYGFDPHAEVLQPYLQGDAVEGVAAVAVIEALHEAQGLAVLAHPFRYSVAGAKLVERAAQLGIDGLEVYYAYKNPDPWSPSYPQTEEAEALADRLGLFKTCGTDTHGNNLTRRI